MFSAKRSRVGVSQQLCVLLRMETDRKILLLFFFSSFFSHQHGSWNVDQTASCALFLTLTFAQNAGLGLQTRASDRCPEKYSEVTQWRAAVISSLFYAHGAHSACLIGSSHWLAALFFMHIFGYGIGKWWWERQNTGQKNTANMQTWGWKHICQISRDVETTNSRLFALMHGNITNSNKNKRYVSTN